MNSDAAPILDLSIPTLMKTCRGRVELLPSFVVHSDSVWPDPRRTQLDTQNRIHLNRTAFARNVVGNLPVREGLWLRIDAQVWHLDLKPHHLQGGALMEPGKGHRHSRAFTLVDSAGRPITDGEHGIESRSSAATPEPGRLAELRRAAKADSISLSVRSALGNLGGNSD